MIKKFNQSRQRGFTLVELLIVIAVIGILAAIIIATIDPIKRINQSKDARVKNDMGSIIAALQVYYTDVGTTGTATYPATSGWQTSLTASNAMKLVPADPNSAQYSYTNNSGVAELQGPLFDQTGAFSGYKTWCWTSNSATINASSNSASGATCP